MLNRWTSPFEAPREFGAHYWHGFFDQRPIRTAAAFSEARDLARASAAGGVQRWLERWDSLGVPAATALRNAVADSSEEDIPVVLCLLDLDDAFPPDAEADNVRRTLKKSLGSLTPEWRWLRVLLSKERAPTAAEFRHAAALDPVSRTVAALALAHGADPTGRTIARVIRAVAADAESTTPLDLDDLAASFAGRVPARMGREDLALIPPVVRQRLLFSPAARQALLTEEFEAALRSDPASHPDTPEGLGTLAPRVRRAVAEGRVTPTLKRWIEAEAPFLAQDEKESILWEGIDMPAGRKLPAKEFAVFTGNTNLSKDLQNAFAFLSESRSEAIESSGKYGPDWSLTVRCSVLEWLETIGETRDSNLRLTAFEKLVGTRGEKVWAELIRRSRRNSEARDLLLEMVSEGIDPPHQHRVPLQDFGEAALWAEHLQAAFLHLIARRWRPGRVVDWILDHLPPDLREAHDYAASPLWREIALTSAGYLRGEGRRAARDLLRGIAAHSHKGTALPAMLGNPSSGDPHRSVILQELAALRTWVVRNALGTERLVPVVEAWREALNAEIRSLKEAGRKVPRGIERLVRLLGEGAARTAFKLHPVGFIGGAVRSLPFREVLAEALRDAAVGGALEDEVSRARLRRQIPWIRRKWKRQPARATAYEVAAAFSLRDSRFLVHLAGQAGPPADPECAGTTFDHLYTTYELPKKSGGSRLITAPSDKLKRLQRRLLDRGFGEIPLHPAATGFIPGSSTLDNAVPHVGKQLVVNADIESFFPRTRHPLIVRACGQLCEGRLSPRAIMFVADLCSYDGGLPTGAPTSPTIGNLVLRPVDAALAKAAARFDIMYTRYADDLTFSGAGEVHRILPFVRRVLADFGFELKEKKVNLFRKGRRQVVTGLVVNEKPNLPRRIRRRLRAAVHQRVQGRTPHWHDRPMSDDELMGRIAVLTPVQPDEARRLRKQLQAARRATRGKAT